MLPQVNQVRSPKISTTTQWWWGSFFLRWFFLSTPGILPAKFRPEWPVSCSVQAKPVKKWCSGNSLYASLASKFFFYLSLRYSNYQKVMPEWHILIIGVFQLPKSDFIPTPARCILITIKMTWGHYHAGILPAKVMSPVWWHKNEFQVCWDVPTGHDVSSSNTRSMVSTISVYYQFNITPCHYWPDAPTRNWGILSGCTCSYNYAVYNLSEPSFVDREKV